MNIKLLHIYDDLMNLYGEYANIAVLERYLSDLGHSVRVDRLSLYEDRDISGYDFYYMGSGTESKQKLALSQLLKYRDALKTAVEEEKVLLFTGNSFELLGASVTDADGKEYKCLRLADFVTVEGKRRIVGDALAQYGDDLLVGFINKCSKTSGIDTPLFAMKLGFGNEKDRSAEGFRLKNCFGTHLTGPILVKNPRMLREIASLLIGQPVESACADSMERAYQTTVDALKQRLAQEG